MKNIHSRKATQVEEISLMTSKTQEILKKKTPSQKKREKPHLYLLEGLFLGERNWSSWSSWLFSENHKQTRNGGAVDKQLVTR